MSKGKILIVDDTKIVCLSLEAELTDAGFDVESAFGGEGALDKVKDGSFDLVFTDLVMPGVNGVELCRDIKKASPRTEVVLMSGHPAEVEQNKQPFLDAGGRDEFLRKPFQPGEVVEVANSILAKDKPYGGKK